MDEIPALASAVASPVRGARLIKIGTVYRRPGHVQMVTSARRAATVSIGFSAALLVFLLPGPIADAEPKGRLQAFEYDCVIEPEQIVRLASPVVGVVAHLDVDRGDIVRKGQILGKLRDEVETAALALARARATNQFPVKSAEARLEFLRLKRERIDELHSKAVSPLAALQEIQAETHVAEQQLKEASLNREIARLEVQHAEEIVNQRTLRSPVNGVVVERHLVPGEYRNEQSPILTIAQIDQLRVEVFVPTARYGEIRTGSRGEVKAEAPIGGTFAATVTVVDRVLDAASGTFGVRLALPNPDLLLPAGIRCKVVFEKITG